MKTFVKFSGLTEASWLEQVPKGGAAGFVVEVADSPCTLSVESTARLAESVPGEIEVWAVTCDPAPELIHRLFDEVGVDRIQVFGTVPQGLEFLETHHIVPSVPIPPKAATALSRRFLALRTTRSFTSTRRAIQPRWEVRPARTGRSAVGSWTPIRAASSFCAGDSTRRTSGRRS